MPAASVPLPRSKTAIYLVAAIASVVTAAVLANVATIPNLGWYETLAKPTFNPPNWLFGPAWMVFYTLMAFAFYRVLRHPAYVPDRRGAIEAFLVQIALNAAWSWAFFAAHSPALGLIVIGAMLIAVVMTIRRFFGVDRTAGWSLVPYLVWLVFASLLNLSILMLNRNG